MARNHEHHHHSDTTGNFTRAQFEQQLAPHTHYEIDTEQPIDTRVVQDYFACAMITIDKQSSDISTYNPKAYPGTFLLVNTKHLPVRTVVNEENLDDTTSFRGFAGSYIPADADYLLLDSTYTPNIKQNGWLPISDGNSYDIGRETDTSQHFELSRGRATMLSRNHFTLTYKDGVLLIADNGSTNGTIVTTAAPLVAHLETPATELSDPLKQEYGDILHDHTRERIIQKVGELAGKGLEDKALDRAVWKEFHPDIHRGEIPRDASTETAARLEQKHHATYLAAQQLVEQFGKKK